MTKAFATIRLDYGPAHILSLAITDRIERTRANERGLPFATAEAIESTLVRLRDDVSDAITSIHVQCRQGASE